MVCQWAKKTTTTLIFQEPTRYVICQASLSFRFASPGRRGDAVFPQGGERVVGAPHAYEDVCAVTEEDHSIVQEVVEHLQRIKATVSIGILFD